ncbi:hypothetical protein M2271_003481 [Streptomyces sp. LBL]|nr:hypothetical protein [Streptomyces sp. LBL]MDH6625670.1 hypothetical protein [Streptomyces sp. LBL]
MSRGQPPRRLVPPGGRGEADEADEADDYMDIARLNQGKMQRTCGPPK